MSGCPVTPVKWTEILLHKEARLTMGVISGYGEEAWAAWSEDFDEVSLFIR